MARREGRWRVWALALRTNHRQAKALLGCYKWKALLLMVGCISRSELQQGESGMAFLHRPP